MFVSPQLFFWNEQQNSFRDYTETFFDPDLARSLTGEPCTARSPHTHPESHAAIRLHLQGVLCKTIGCHKDYKNEFDFSRYTSLTSIERKYQKEITSVLHIQMLL